ncbi:DNA-(apurinic or apyrimidinic site) lyase 2 [Bagarius yarrelli]|uniref:DNA-(apurinic or apyrimidinic site) endonuclease n=1 Tax=Bagarius yarrelli TaxID=175774 RepID=A0A556VB55_BAGYA|nr:DNA-(apurinic or apyrimidinic site) lyase 2 [Bagarius yarrelli]
MKIISWNINGIRTFKNGIKSALDALDADVICVQETKVTRDLLDEKTAIVDGYNSYFSFSRGRTGYSGVATFCKDSVTPFAAEEGLTGRLANHGEAVGCYGDMDEFSIEELQSLDNEGRAVITQHKFMPTVEAEDFETLTVINVYCPRADPEKPERKYFKLQFYKLLQIRAQAILGPKSHVIILGDINTSHRQIDHCDPDDVENFEDNPGRKWLDSLLSMPAGNINDDDEGDSEKSRNCVPGGNFIDTFRHFHPSRANAFTCWSTRTGARQTNYGTRIDYIFANRLLVEGNFLNADIMPEVEGSDHCPIWAELSCKLIPTPKCPALCTCFMPEFMGKQQKLLRFLVKVSEQKTNGRDVEKPLPGSQEDEEIIENLNPLAAGVSSGSKRPSDGLSESSFKAKKSKHAKTTTKPQGSLLTFFKPKAKPVTSLKQNLIPCEKNETRLKSECVVTEMLEITENNVSSHVSIHNTLTKCNTEVKEKDETCNFSYKTTKMEEKGCQDQIQNNTTPCQETKKGSCPDFWKSVLHGPPQPPMCNVHSEPCVLRTVKKPGPNLGRQFFVCARPQGHSSNPQARCNFFAWVDKRK